jgi:hypothetical protein
LTEIAGEAAIMAESQATEKPRSQKMIEDGSGSVKTEPLREDE